MTFTEARPKDMIVSTNMSPRSNADSQDLHGREALGNAHAALAQVKVKNKSKKDKTFVHFGNDNWNLVLHMLFGIR